MTKPKIRKGYAPAGGRRKRSGRKTVPAMSASAGGKSEYDQGYDAGYGKGYADHLAYSVNEMQHLEQKLTRLQTGKSEGREGSYAAGRKAGYDEGSRNGYARAAEHYDRGCYEGGEAIIDDLLPAHFILPDFSLRQIIETGLQQLQSQWIRVMSSEEVADAILAALDHRKPLSVVRLGDGELLTLCQDTVLTAEEVRARGDFLEYAGVAVPDWNARDVLCAAVAQADIVGVPRKRMKNFQPLLVPALRALGLDCRQMQLTYSTVNYSLFHQGFLSRLMKERRILIVGNKAKALSDVLSGYGYDIAPAVFPVLGMRDVPRVMERVREHDFDLALISAGVAAVPLAQRIAAEMGRVALDLGHLADMITSGKGLPGGVYTEF